ncbi:hypothetical protein B0J11DRAFT_53696 [Dendryphion nanum]|uniref:Uncharacterized protein n=1 Tax=Dendryphion nanum TaxID=256645 RepID=A0A9P9DL66_9PLEO|nr:hypothetical protein B0J11DRAFT_53696 [Dendryphion nanum]
MFTNSPYSTVKAHCATQSNYASHSSRAKTTTSIIPRDNISTCPPSQCACLLSQTRLHSRLATLQRRTLPALRPTAAPFPITMSSLVTIAFHKQKGFPKKQLQAIHVHRIRITQVSNQQLNSPISAIQSHMPFPKIPIQTSHFDSTPSSSPAIPLTPHLTQSLSPSSFHLSLRPLQIPPRTKTLAPLGTVIDSSIPVRHPHPNLALSTGSIQRERKGNVHTRWRPGSEVLNRCYGHGS